MKHSLLLAVAIASVAFGADKYTIASARPSATAPRQIKVRFAESAAPSATDAIVVAHWGVQAITPTGVVTGTIAGTPTTGADYKLIPLVRLDIQFQDAAGTPIRDFPANTVRYLVTYSQDGQLATRAELVTRPPDPELKSNSDNNVTLFGGINSAVGAKPTFKIDGAMDFHPLGNGMGIAAKVKTDSRRKVDPDSFSANVNYRYLLSTARLMSGGQTVFQGAELQLDFAGMEFDRKGKNLNFVSSPYIVLPFNFHTAPDGTVTNLVGFDVKLGFEAGDNFRNSLNENGYGAFLRTLGGGALSLTMRSIPGFKKVVIASNYEVRLPNKAELFGTTDNAGTTTYGYSKKARHWISNSVNFFFDDHWSFSVQHSYGSLPPAFNFTDQQVSLGLKYTLKTK